MSITDSWSSGCLPIKNGLYRADGLARAVRVGPRQPGGLELLDSFSPAGILSDDPEYVTYVDVTGLVMEVDLDDAAFDL
ncbi:hypothetical protein ABZ422_16650 [Micromonospora zamorensis]|uniref:hypothetical protein n=1 Tax=Micromonospora zamorensis TaxID=709883 RepID=UPI00117FF927|nr:hypothetical protein [Micromonospora zamorensis]WTE85924.1 hypothetical protein OHA01_25715 [Micromonospora zamorensis]